MTSPLQESEVGRRRVPMAEHMACHAAHVRDWPLRAKVWVWWGCQGWWPAVVTGYTKYRVRVELRPKVGNGVTISPPCNWRRKRGAHGPWSLPSPNNLRPRFADNDPPPLKRADETCLTLSAIRASAPSPTVEEER